MAKQKNVWVLLGITAAGTLLAAQAPNPGPARFAISDPGVAVADERLLVAVPLKNIGGVDVVDVQIRRVMLDDRPLLEPDTLPASLGAIPAGKDAVLQLEFGPSAFDRVRGRDRRLMLHIEGTAVLAGRAPAFSVHRRIDPPPPTTGGRPARVVTIRPHRFEGGDFPPSPGIVGPEDVNDTDRPPLPERGLARNSGPDNPGIGILPRDVDAGAGIEPPARGTNSRISIVRAGTLPIGGGVPWDPSGGSVDVLGAFGLSQRVVLLSGNRYLLMSGDGGTTFTSFDPSTIAAGAQFPKEDLPFDLGLCCDQNVLYVPQIDRFLWLMLTAGSVADFKRDENGLVKDKNGDLIPINAFNRLRLCSASPQEVMASSGKDWTCWDMSTSKFGLTSGLPFMDYPDLTTTGSYAYVSATLADRGQFLVARIPLAEILAGGSITIGHTDPQDSPFGQARLAHDVPDAAYWFGHGYVGDKEAQLGVFEWPDGVGGYGWHYLSVPPWAPIKPGTAGSTSFTGDVTNDWLTANIDSVRGATLQSDITIVGGFLDGQTARRILVAWNAAAGGGFSQPYVRLQSILRTSGGFWLAGEASQIWNPGFAFQHAHLSSNASFEAGVSVAAGGGGNEATPVAGFIGDSTLYVINPSTASICRWGDYTAIRRHWPNSQLFSVSDYFLEQWPTGRTFSCPNGPTSQKFRAVHQYRLFGRTADVGGTH